MRASGKKIAKKELANILTRMEVSMWANIEIIINQARVNTPTPTAIFTKAN
jgi:hypothetical protein